ncbi:MAG: hypothetical protein KF765_11400 [Parvibaculaceae bacterium]|nr:hypothetical protein [Parvibaculaceae bacterium]
MPSRDPNEAALNARSNLIRMSLVFMAMAGVIAFYIGTGRVQLNDPVELTVQVTQPRSWTEAGPLTLAVNVTLANNTGEAMPLEIDSQCKIFRWFLTDRDQNFVQSQRGDEACVDVPMRGELEGKHSISGEYELELDPSRVKPGDYILFMNYWGNERREPVTIR